MLYERPNLCYMKLCNMKGQIYVIWKAKIYVVWKAKLMLHEIMQ